MADLLHDAAFTSYIGQQYGCYALTDGVVLSQIIDSELGPELERTFNESQSNNFRNRYFNQSMQVGGG